MQDVASDLTARETMSLIAADKVDGTDVRNRQGESVGTIERVMLDKQSGKVAYAVMRFGGFLGMGVGRTPLPWPLLEHDPNVGGYVLDVEPDTLKSAPRIDDDLDADFDDRRWRDPLYKHYQIPPYRG